MTITTHLRWLETKKYINKKMPGAKSYGDDCKAVLQPHFKIIHMTRDKGIQAIIPATADRNTNIYSIAALSLRALSLTQ